MAGFQHEIDAEVDLLYGWGFDWPTIARALGVTRQAARQRHHRRHSANANSTDSLRE